MELRQIEREARKIVVESGGRHPCSSIALLYKPRSKRERGLRSVEMEYKATKIKGAVRLHGNEDPALGMVLEFEEKAARTGRRSIFKEGVRCAEEFGLELESIRKCGSAKCSIQLNRLLYDCRVIPACCWIIYNECV